MISKEPSFFARLLLAIQSFFWILGNAPFAGRVQRLHAGEPEDVTPPVPAAPPAPEPVKLREAPTDAALQLLGLLQREGRLVDFLEEEIAGYSDAQVGAAARVVHDQCRKALRECVTLERIRAEAEGARVSVPPGFAAGELRLVGHVAGEPPFNGALVHAGWRAARVALPKLTEGHDLRVIAPAEVEL